jgi:hypothetical protein
MMQLPIVRISTFGQRVTDDRRYNRIVRPIGKPSKIHSLTIDAVTIFVQMRSSCVDGNFTIMGPDDELITATQYAVANKAATRSLFLDLKK